MDTNKLKKFAVEARNKLKTGVAAKIQSLGFDKNGNVPDSLHPQLVQGGTVWNGQLLAESFYHQWNALYRRIRQKEIREVCEEAAYTWFNRLVAIRILQKNGIIEPVLQYVDDAHTPQIVDDARVGRIPQMQEAQRNRLMELLDDDAKVTQQFAVLIAAFCHNTPVLNACFGSVADYTELLLPNDILTTGGFVDMLNHTEFITDDDYCSPELIGWLYQFYISERKDEVFAKKGKYTADEIPAATQIFTPNWIVKYMVQNTVGRIFLDNNPSAVSTFKPRWPYLVEPSEPTPQEAIFKYNELTDLKVGDLACGSGHILNECFDLLYDLYIYEGYSRREAVENIFSKNLRGVDLDTRAKQLSLFALLLKACQKDPSFADAHTMPDVLDMPQPFNEKEAGCSLYDACLKFIGGYENVVAEDLQYCFEEMEDADSLGSIMKLDLDKDFLELVKYHYDDWTDGGTDDCPDEIRALIPGVKLILTLNEKYSALVMNPPYMGSGNMNATLSKYVKENYPDAKADLFSVFMEVAIDRLAEKGKYGMINMHSWMFLSSFEELRKSILENYWIESLLHLGTRTFDELSGEVVQNVAFVINKVKTLDDKGIYYRLVDGKNCEDKKNQFLQAKLLNNIYYPNIIQNNFDKIPGCPIGYWVSRKAIDTIAKSSTIYKVATPRQGLATGDNNRFLRFIWEVDKNKRGKQKWVPCTKGGSFRKWYGNIEYCVNWEDNGYELKNFRDVKGKLLSRPQNEKYYFKSIGSTWSTISSGKAAFRFFSNNWLFETKGSVCFPLDEDDNDIILAYLNSPLVNYYLKVYTPTMDYHEGPVGRLPYLLITDSNILQRIRQLVKQNIAFSKYDWDAHETSWDFKENELLRTFKEESDLSGNNPQLHLIDVLMEYYKSNWEERFEQLHQNEEELNRQFIEIYGLQDELTPEVLLNEITILQQGEITITDNNIQWNDDVLIKQFISYAVGVWMGRYRLDKPGLHIAHPNPTADELAPYDYSGNQVCIDDDGLIPILPKNSPFEDNLYSRIADFIRIVFGEENLAENLNFMEECLGMSIEQYVMRDFWKDHLKMYKNRPIYWLFSSKKGAFKCLAYMHRMDAYTAERVRQNYLLKYIDFLKNQVLGLEAKAALLTTAENRQLQKLRKDLAECEEYHDRLQVVAERAIAFDLDDGVVVNYAKFCDVLQKIK